MLESLKILKYFFQITEKTAKRPLEHVVELLTAFIWIKASLQKKSPNGFCL